MNSTNMYAPWFVGDANEADRSIGIRDDADFVIAEMCDDTAYSAVDMKAKARLIASAPMLLEALTSIVDGGLSTSRIAAARAAIAAATGETK